MRSPIWASLHPVRPIERVRDINLHVPILPQQTRLSVEKILSQPKWGIMGKEYLDRQDKPLREEYREVDERPMRVAVDSMPWSGGQSL